MKMYCDKMPKNCWECPCFKNDIEQSCGLDYEDKGFFLDEIDGGECPLKSITDLQEQLKNAIVPKFKIGQEVFFVIDKVEQAKVEKLIFTIGKLDDETMKSYSITDAYGYALRLPEEQIFATREEAEKGLAELEGK